MSAVPSRPRSRAWLDAGCLACAVAAHSALVFAPTRAAERPAPMRPLEFVEVVAPPPAPEPPRAVPPAAPPPRAHTRTRTAPRALPPEPETQPPVQTPPAAAPAVMTAPTGGDTSFGGVADGRVAGSGEAVGTPTGGAGTAAEASPGPARVARGPADLRADVRPPPDLARRLASYYPDRARTLGTTGEARIRLRLDAGGQVLAATVTFESPVGFDFGAACRRLVLEGPAWSPALDLEGRPIARVGRDFRCEFARR